jgi:quercetin dioxygenase-like cupin family protein
MIQTDETREHEKYTTAVDEGRWPRDAAVPLPTHFENESGKIQNLLLKPVKSVAAIESVKGSVRANHLHKTDWHYAYVVSGKVLYFEREAGNLNIPQPRAFGPGEMFFTPPGVEHAMLFAEESVIFTLAKNVRSHEEHEADLVRVSFITPEIAREYVR